MGMWKGNGDGERGMGMWNGEWGLGFVQLIYAQAEEHRISEARLYVRRNGSGSLTKRAHWWVGLPISQCKRIIRILEWDSYTRV